MQINLKLDNNGEPYLELVAVKTNYIDDEVMKSFIVKALKRKVYIKNETNTTIRADYASIRLMSIEGKE